jgi:transcriptional regulator with XRE-family HTH domain
MPTIRELRESKDMTREELAVKAHVSMFTIARLETGKHVPRFNTLEAIARALKVKSNEIEFPEKES